MFGSFFKRDEKADDAGEDMKKSTTSYGYIADNKKSTTFTEFKLVGNQENYSTLAKAKAQERE